MNYSYVINGTSADIVINSCTFEPSSFVLNPPVEISIRDDEQWVNVSQRDVAIKGVLVRCLYCGRPSPMVDLECPRCGAPLPIKELP